MLLMEQNRLFETLSLFTSLEKLKIGLFVLDQETIENLTSLLESRKKKLTSLSVHNLGFVYGSDIKPSQNK